jgi:predicted transcriptional regulator
MGCPAPDSTYWLAAERAAKRALHTLWKRGEVGRITVGRHNRYGYITAETYNESFSPQVMKKLREAMERMPAALEELERQGSETP